MELVAEELVQAAPQPQPDREAGQRYEVEKCVPVRHGMNPARRVGEVLAAPDRQDGANDEGLKANHQQQLPTTTAAIDLIDLLRGQMTLFDGHQHIGHWVFPPAATSGLALQPLIVLNHKPTAKRNRSGSAVYKAGR